jgi:hypothetical protein
MHYRIIVFSSFLLLPLYGATQTLEKITSNYIEFVGGKKNWKNLKTLMTTGEYDYGGISFPFKTYAKAPDLYRFIVESNGKYYAQGFDGNKGWKIDTFKNETTPTILDGSMATSMANESSVELMDVFLRSKSRSTMEYAGKDSVRSHFCYRVKLVENGTIETFYFDVATYELVMKKTVSKNVELDKAPMNIYYSDYRNVGGIKIPFKTVCESDQQVILTITVDKVILDQPMDEKEFETP